MLNFEFKIFAGFLIVVATAVLPLQSSAQLIGGGGEILPDTILALEDLHAQCIHPEERAIFTYAKSLKRLEWYRSEYYSEIEEQKMKTLAYGIVQRDTGQSVLPGYRDIRDMSVTSDAKTDPYTLTRSNYTNFYWANKPRPQYSPKDCKAHAQKWMNAFSKMERKMPGPFPELKKYLEMADPDEFMRISKKIGSCSKYEPGKHWVFINETSFNAWMSGNFSKSYGKKVILSRPIYQQLDRELAALGAAASAATHSPFESLSKTECSTLNDAIAAYESKHLRP